nr:MAG TPA: hypothetical protein [Caudoviricetes sp.]
MLIFELLYFYEYRCIKILLTLFSGFFENFIL